MRRPGPGRHPDAGNASVEFLGVALLLMVPLVYLVVVLGRLQGAAMATDTAARHAVRVFAATDPELAGPAATAVADLALADHGFTAGEDALTMQCSADPCHVPGATVTAVVAIDVDLPGVPGFLRDAVPVRIPVSSRATGAVDTFREGP